MAMLVVHFLFSIVRRQNRSTVLLVQAHRIQKTLVLGIGFLSQLGKHPYRANMFSSLLCILKNSVYGWLMIFIDLLLHSMHA